MVIEYNYLNLHWQHAEGGWFAVTFGVVFKMYPLEMGMNCDLQFGYSAAQLLHGCPCFSCTPSYSTCRIRGSAWSGQALEATLLLLSGCSLQEIEQGMSEHLRSSCAAKQPNGAELPNWFVPISSTHCPRRKEGTADCLSSDIKVAQGLFKELHLTLQCPLKCSLHKVSWNIFKMI